MALYYNNANIAQSANVLINNQAASQVLYNNALVWKRKPDWLFYAGGNQYPEWTGNWSGSPSSVIWHAGDWDSHNCWDAAVGTYLTAGTTGSGQYGGSLLRTNSVVDLSGVTTLTASLQCENPGIYRFFTFGVFSAIGGSMFAKQVIHLNGYGTGNFNIALNVSSLTWGYVGVGAYTSDGYDFTAYITSIKCD